MVRNEIRLMKRNCCFSRIVNMSDLFICADYCTFYKEDPRTTGHSEDIFGIPKYSG